MKEDSWFPVSFYVVWIDSESQRSALMKEDLLVFDVVYCLEGQ